MAEATTWQLKGKVLGACNCDYGCPCNFNAPPTTGDCEGTWTWHVEQGRFGAVRLDSLSFTVFADWPGAIHEGNGKAVAFHDERADEDQREAILTLLSGDAAGPWGIFINTFAFVLEPRPAPHELEISGERRRVRVGAPWSSRPSRSRTRSRAPRCTRAYCCRRGSS